MEEVGRFDANPVHQWEKSAMRQSDYSQSVLTTNAAFTASGVFGNDE